eukprot:g39820.t1
MSLVKVICRPRKAPKAEYEVLLLQFPGGVVVILEDAQNEHVIQGVRDAVEVVCDWKVLSFVANRVQMLYKVDLEPPLGLTDVE